MADNFMLKPNNPYLEIESRLENKLYKIDNLENGLVASSKKCKRYRRIYKRSIVLSIIYTIITFGVYGIFWQFEITKEINGLSKDNSYACPLSAVLLSIITFGIYGVYWSYRIGQKQNKFYKEINDEHNGYHVLYLILSLASFPIPVLYLIKYAIMQYHINQMVDITNSIYKDGVYVKDSNLFNRPYLSMILLIIIVLEIPEIIINLYDWFFIGTPGNPINNLSSVVDVAQVAIQNSTQQLMYANTPYVLSRCFLQIFLVIAVLWWFKLRFKHTDYKGVLVLKNFGRGCLFALPGLLFVAINLLDFDILNCKFGVLLLGFVPGFTEEIAFRGMIIPNLMRIFNRLKGIWLSLFLTSFIFGAIHLANIFAGADFGTTIFQASYAFALGVLFAGILIRTGSLWPSIIVHGLIDATGLMTSTALEQGFVQAQPFEFSIVLIPIFAIMLLFILFTIIICRPDKHKEICDMWAEKWGNAILK